MRIDTQYTTIIVPRFNKYTVTEYYYVLCLGTCNVNTGTCIEGGLPQYTSRFPTYYRYTDCTSRSHQ